MQKYKLDSLPDDLLYDIASRLSVRDIIRVRQTSKQFNGITSERIVWSQVYRTSDLLLRPGPYPYQSAKNLENILVRSEKLEVNWASSQIVSRRVITQGSRGPIHLSLLLGRWLLAGDELGLRCYDLDDVEGKANPVTQIPVKVNCLGSGIVTSDEGLHSAFAVIRQMKNYIKIFKVHLPPSSIHFELVFEEHWPDNSPFAVSIGMDCLVVTSHRRILLMNIHTYHVFDPLPEPHCGLAATVGAQRFYIECIVTETHLLVAYILIGREAWIEAFLLPSSTSPIFSRSHTAHCPFWFTSATVLRSSVSSSTQGAVPEVVLLVSKGPHSYYKTELGFLRLRLLLDGTLSVAMTHVQTLDFATFYLSVTSSHGLARAVGYGSPMRGSRTTYGFSISEDAETGYAVSHTKLAEDVELEGCAFDGFEGRLCFPGTELDSCLTTVKVFNYA